MKTGSGLTLIELQIAAILLTVVLVATGVAFYFALGTIRYIQDAFEVHMNAHTAIKVITREVVIANRYGWSPLPSTPATDGPYDPIGSGQPWSEFACIANGRYVTLDVGASVFQDAAAIVYLRQDVPPISWLGVGDTTPHRYWDDDVTVFYLSQPPGWVAGDPFELRIVKFPGGATPTNAIGAIANGTGELIATNITNLTFNKHDFNHLGVQVTVQGDIADPLSAEQYNEITLRTRINLHSAPARASEPIWATDAASGYASFYW